MFGTNDVSYYGSNYPNGVKSLSFPVLCVVKTSSLDVFLSCGCDLIVFMVKRFLNFRNVQIFVNPVLEYAALLRDGLLSK